MEAQAVVEAGFDELHEVGHRGRGFCWEQLEVDIAFVGLE